MIPTRVTRKQAQPRQQKKDVLRTGFDIHPVGDDHYYGFTLTGDGRYLLGDFTVTHNTEIAIHLVTRARKRDMRIALVCDRRVFVKQTSKRFAKYGIPHGVAMAEQTFGRSMPIQV